MPASLEVRGHRSGSDKLITQYSKSRELKYSTVKEVCPWWSPSETIGSTEVGEAVEIRCFKSEDKEHGFFSGTRKWPT